MDLFLGLFRPLQLNVVSDAWSEGGQFFYGRNKGSACVLIIIIKYLPLRKVRESDRGGQNEENYVVFCGQGSCQYGTKVEKVRMRWNRRKIKNQILALLVALSLFGLDWDRPLRWDETSAVLLFIFYCLCSCQEVSSGLHPPVLPVQQYLQEK